MLVRGLVLPEENAPPKISAQDIVPLEKAAVRLPSLISIRVWLGRNGVADKAGALRELCERKPGETQVRLRLESPRDFSVILDVPVAGPAGQGIPRRRREDLRPRRDRRAGRMIPASSRSSTPSTTTKTLPLSRVTRY